ncbi:sensor histidine kinase [Thiothrix fructosivorans]|uniref:Sensor histidine kinase n=1 Tax=Thiothrix fructosivorans TaxID=111770 RepID=A0A8B0SLC7_9GAMM|nr:sensor histidine kinase [Thiothrix fructosivorans]MBO0612649.1 sensor histidine kinase [Thiothrix fructosivorans]QTX11881.1 sensor histidine kinase [Thiothrix fructosivorans]
MQVQPPIQDEAWNAYLRRHYYRLLVQVILPMILITVVFLLGGVFCSAIPSGYWLLGYVGLAALFFRFGHALHAELQELFTAQLHCTLIEREAQSLQRDAAVGHSVRVVTHEMNNLIGIANMSVDNLRYSPVAMPKDIDRLEKALGYMTQVTHLILDGIGNKLATTRTLSLAELQDDVRLLIGHGQSYPQVALSVMFPAEAAQYRFEERTGATYLIIHNLVKNALEAVEERFGDQSGGEVRVTAEILGNQIVIAVKDNGVGMTAEQIEAVMRGSGQSFKVNGHGLGLGFVLGECERNGFGFEVERSESNSTGFQIFIITNN